MANHTSKLTDTVRASILDSVSKGMAQRLIAARAGITDRTFRAWMSRGKKGEGEPFTSFYSAVKKAESDAIADKVAVILKAATGTTERTTKRTVFPDGTSKEETTNRKVFEWTAAAWWLERNFPDLYGSDRQRMKHIEKEIAELRKLVGNGTG